MAVHNAKLGTSRTQGYLRSEQDKQLEPVKPNRKRRRLLESVETRGPLRKSARLRERHANQKAEYTSRPVRSSSRALTRRRSEKQEQPGPKSTSCQTQKHRARSRSIKDIGQIETQPKSTSAEAQKNPKRNRSIGDRDTFIRDAKLPKRDDTGDLTPRRKFRKSKFIESWLSKSSWARRDLTDNESLLQTPLDDMPRNAGEVPLSRDDTPSSIPFELPFKRPEKAASVHDSDFRDSLRHRNIYINRENPPVELMRRAKRIITRPRTSPEMDDATAQELRDTARKFEAKSEEDIKQELIPKIIPDIFSVSDSRLTRIANQVWYDAVPIPLHPSVLKTPLPLPKPKPDVAFGYSESAFTRGQDGTIDILTDQSERSYAKPNKNLRLPFFDVEFKSQANGGSHFIAANQAANAGSIALQGNLELIRRGFSVDNLDHNEPQFFSLSMDHKFAQINVHWLGIDADDGQFSFHVEDLSAYRLNELDDLRAFQRAVKNILDYGVDERLQTLCEALNAYRQKVTVEREMAIFEGHQALEVPMKTGETQPRQRSTRTQPLSNRRQEKERQLTHQGLRSIVEGDGPEEPQEQLQSGRLG
ncbi:MAG: hypothetical protein FRX48_07962 [Lasallia pustulata]|uniref:DUF7924 domain-containing protein n=1 Tax=Lasallia pustulata TaxID=136370 RepID=A0A5M8PH35_9LECA|nr:MAG: hypothetical protein FRX48_07962 [Lasallia pustulata]